MAGRSRSPLTRTKLPHGTRDPNAPNCGGRSWHRESYWGVAGKRGRDFPVRCLLMHERVCLPRARALSPRVMRLGIGVDADVARAPMRQATVVRFRRQRCNLSRFPLIMEQFVVNSCSRFAASTVLGGVCLFYGRQRTLSTQLQTECILIDCRRRVGDR